MGFVSQLAAGSNGFETEENVLKYFHIVRDHGRVGYLRRRYDDNRLKFRESKGSGNNTDNTVRN